MAKLKDLTGKKFGRLTVVKRAENDRHGNAMWFCQCECGSESIVVGRDLINRHTKSCGCLIVEVSRERMRSMVTSHGDSRTILYHVWKGMKTRCYNPDAINYYLYGGRGITICPEWREFVPFRDWALANGYDENLTIDRIDYDGNYCPENCRWATAKEQANNRRNNHRLKFYNSDFTISEWSRILNIGKATLYQRIKAGWSVRKTLTTPTRRKVA